MNAEILSIGDELLIGQVANTNASYLGEQLSILGIAVRRVTTVGDRADDLLDAFARAWQEQDIVIATGGLGPTHDDITREAVCRFFETGLVESAEALADVERFLAERNRPVTATNRDQAMVPAAAEVIRNRNGTAPGYHFRRDGKHFFVTPGVPFEMQGMMESYILPLLREISGSTRTTVTLLTTGIPESTLADALGGIESLEEGCTVAYLPSPLGVRVRLTAIAEDAETAEQRIERLRGFVTQRAAEFVYASDRSSLEEILGVMLVERGQTLAVAESCTGGRIADRITDIPGSSRYFERGVVCYSNRSKEQLLGIDPALIAAHGAVSRQTAEAMAERVRLVAGTTFGLSTTGIAGPDGGSAAKPVGLVWIGISSDAGTFAHDFHFGGDRMRTKQRAAQAALDMLRRSLLRLPLQPTSLRPLP
jgi:nicotinamide-nucleotide amidase